MKKAVIYTLYGNSNYGNKLQNYAIQEILLQHGYYSDTVILKGMIDNPLKKTIKNIIKLFSNSQKKYIKINNKRLQNFKEFDKLINKIDRNKVMLTDYNLIEVGSDQVWNSYDKMGRLIVDDINNISFENIISIAASISLDKIDDQYISKYREHFNKIKKLSVREELGKKIIEELTGRKDIFVSLDPTMLLEISEWDKLAKKPQQIYELCPNGEKYILTYFLGKLGSIGNSEIEKFAKENNYKIINMLDKNDPFYICGPSEFIWLEKNASLICTDSFHSSVFAILYGIPFVVFDRDDGQVGKSIMNSRLETLLSKFKLEDKKYNGVNITKENLEADYTEAYKILKEEKKICFKFLSEALDLKDSQKRK